MAALLVAAAAVTLVLAAPVVSDLTPAGRRYGYRCLFLSRKEKDIARKEQYNNSKNKNRFTYFHSFYL